MYIVDLSQHPVTTLALWHGQHVTVKGKHLIAQVKPDHIGFAKPTHSGLIYFNTVESSTDEDLYEREYLRWLNGEMGVTERPVYSNYYQHLRIIKNNDGIWYPVATREEFAAAIAAGNCTVH